MKRSEYNQIVKEIVQKTDRELCEQVQQALNKNGLTGGFVELVHTVPDVTAHIVSEVLEQSGVLSFDEETEDSQ